MRLEHIRLPTAQSGTPPHYFALKNFITFARLAALRAASFSLAVEGAAPWRELLQLAALEQLVGPINPTAEAPTFTSAPSSALLGSNAYVPQRPPIAADTAAESHLCTAARCSSSNTQL